MKETKIPGSVPVRSREGLTRCVRCRRHIEAAATPVKSACPFCANKTPRSARGGLLSGALLAIACGSAEPEAVEPVTNQETVQSETVEEAPAADPGEESEPPDLTPVPVYGLPPQPEPPEEPEEPEAVEPEAEAFEPEPAPSMRPMARYGRVPMNRRGVNSDTSDG